MADLPGAGYDQEDAYFHQKDRELLKRMRAQLDSAPDSLGATVLKCPRCGAEMEEVTAEFAKIDRCIRCGGVFLDRGELELLTHAKCGGLFKRLCGR